MTIRLIYSQQYRKSCVVISLTDVADDVIAACRANGAVWVDWDHDSFVIQLRDDVGPELWTEAALRRSLGKGI